MTTYVLVHGAWSGAHGFRKIRPLLRAEGHEVFTPSLTGIGERVHLVSPLVDLSTHIHDVVNQVLYEDLNEITLMGFSYGGMVVTGALAHIAERIRHLVYLDAFVPADGQSVLDLVGIPDEGTIRIGSDWLITSTRRAYDDPADAEWSDMRRVAQPAATLAESVRLSQPLESYPFTRTYIKAIGDPRTAPGGEAFWAAADRAKVSDAWRYREIDTNHLVANNRPKELAEILLELS
ncbi:MAG: alpha/beta hydrolase [Acidimicrobiales bacterium]